MDKASFNTPRVPEGVIAQPSAPAFSSSHALIRSSRGPSPSGGTPIRMRTGKRRSASAIMNPELAAIGVPFLFSPNLAHLAPVVQIGVHQDRRMRVLKAGAVYFLFMFAVGWILGPIRELWAMPRFGRLTSVLLEAVIMLIAMAVSAQWVIRRFHVKPE